MYITVPYGFIWILVLLLLQYGNFSCKWQISWCNAYWRGETLLERTLTSMQILKDAAVVLRLLEEIWSIKNNESWYKQCGVTQHLSTGENLLEKYWKKINIDLINQEKLFDESTNHKQRNIPFIFNLRN